MPSNKQHKTLVAREDVVDYIKFCMKDATFEQRYVLSSVVGYLYVDCPVYDEVEE